MTSDQYAGQAVITGEATAPLLFADVPLSFMGGVDPATGLVTDTHHPLCGQSVVGAVLAIPSGRGSCSGSGVLFELLLNGHAPAAFVFCHDEAILTLGVALAAELFDVSVPIVRLSSDDFGRLRGLRHVRIDGPTVAPADPMDELAATPSLPELDLSDFTLSGRDRGLLAGAYGEAARLAIRVIIRAAQFEGARDLIDIERGHIDGCFYQGPASLRFVERLVELGGRVAVPASMNAICVDRRRWREQGVSAGLGEPSEAMADAYVRLGVAPTYTCAPYQLDDPPHFGQQIAWAESNAVVYANSVLGARTLKYPDYLDILVALTGRAPNAGPHTDAGRRATRHFAVDVPTEAIDDSFYPTLGYYIGSIATHDIAVLTGLEQSGATADDLRAFGAAFATSSAAPMFHIVGVTPEAPTLSAVLDPAAADGAPLPVTADELTTSWQELNSAREPHTELIALGNPHFSLAEYGRLAELCRGRSCADGVAVIVTSSRDTHAKAEEAGYVASLGDFGVTFAQDACWCFIGEPVVPPRTRTITTTSGKYAHYGTAAVGRGLHLRSLAGCVEAASTGHVRTALPAWLAAR